MNKSSNIECDIHCNIQIQLDYIQMRNAIDLCGNALDYVYKVFFKVYFMSKVNISNNHHYFLVSVLKSLALKQKFIF